MNIGKRIVNTKTFIITSIGAPSQPIFPVSSFFHDDRSPNPEDRTFRGRYISTPQYRLKNKSTLKFGSANSILELRGPVRGTIHAIQPPSQHEELADAPPATTAVLARSPCCEAVEHVDVVHNHHHCAGALASSSRVFCWHQTSPCGCYCNCWSSTTEDVSHHLPRPPRQGPMALRLSRLNFPRSRA